MARQHWISGNDGDPQRDEVVERICRRRRHSTRLCACLGADGACAILAPLPVQPLRRRGARSAERALALDPNIAEAHCVKGIFLREQGHLAEADTEMATAVALNPKSWEVNKEAGRHFFRHGHFAKAVPYFEKAVLPDGDRL